MKKTLNHPLVKALLALCFSCLLLLVVYRKVDLAQLSQIYETADASDMTWFLLLFIPQFFLAGLRWQKLVNLSHKSDTPALSLGRGISQVLASYTPNLVIPGKLGEMLRALMVRESVGGSMGAALIILEKVCDIAALALIAGVCFFLTAIYGHGWLPDMLLALGCLVCVVMMVFLIRGGVEFALKARRWENGRLGKVLRPLIKVLDGLKGASDVKRWAWGLGISFLLWLVQLAQFYFAVKAAGDSPPLSVLISWVAVALVAGAVPFTVGGLGVRDAVLVLGLSSWLAPASIAWIGLAAFIRVLLPTIIGLIPFLLTFATYRHASEQVVK